MEITNDNISLKKIIIGLSCWCLFYLDIFTLPASMIAMNAGIVPTDRLLSAGGRGGLEEDLTENGPVVVGRTDI